LSGLVNWKLQKKQEVCQLLDCCDAELLALLQLAG